MNPERHHLAAMRHAVALALQANVALQRAQIAARAAQLTPPVEPAERDRYVEAHLPAWRAYWQANARCRLDHGDDEQAFIAAMSHYLEPVPFSRN